MTDIHKEIDSLKVKSGYSGKPQQWQYGFDLACRELAKAQAVPEGYVLMPIKPTKTMVMAVAKEHEGDAFLPYSLYDAYVKQAMIEVAQDKNNESK